MLNERPLAHILRPKNIEDFVGQEHLLGENGPIRNLCEAKQLCSMILWGPPGCGKTSLVSLLEHYWELPIVHLSAINSGVKDIKNIVKNQRGLFQQQQIVFVDEIHRFNKAQQDAFLPYVENGDIVLIGASTENPAFSINSALLSRTRVFTLRALSKEDLEQLVYKALEYLSASQNGIFKIEDAALALLINQSAGDARKLLSNLEVAAQITNQTPSKPVNNKAGTELFKIDANIIANASGQSIASFDKNGDHYYDILSAFHKSVRGSSCDGALYWYARLLIANSDVTPICRRLLAIASEDIGNADPRALQICLNAWDTYHRVGAAEGERAIAQAVIYSALAAKSNATYVAFKKAKRLASEHSRADVPVHLRNATSKITQDLGHGKDYQYAHNYEFSIAPNQQYLPDDVELEPLYEPSDRGYEKQLAAKIEFLKQVQAQGNKV